MHDHTILKQFFFFLLFLFPHLAAAQQQAPQILVSIKPLHSLVSGLTKGITTPALLIESQQSPHDYSLRPSDRRRIEQADMIIYTGTEIEPFIADIQKSTPNKLFIPLSRIPAMQALPARSVSHHKHHGHDGNHQIDGHIWLSINNAMVMVNYLCDQLIQLDPNNQQLYINNRDLLIERLDRLKQDIAARFSDIKQQPFIQFHDAFQYFEKEFGLNNSLFVTTSPENPVGIKQLKSLKTAISSQNIQCVFYEPPVIPKILYSLTEDSQARILPLEPLGSELNAGENLYFELLDNIAKQLATCLKDTKQ